MLYLEEKNINCECSYITMAECMLQGELQYTDQEMIPARNARNVVTLSEVMFVTIQR
jgi:hypothetical protein